MGIIIVLIIIIVFVVKVKSGGSRTVDNMVANIAGEKDRCLNCKFCCSDKSHQFSNTDYFCRLSKCDYIDSSTVMNCVVKPTVTEQDLQELFKLGIWTASGKQYIRNQLLGKKMGFADVDEFLKRLPNEHPEYIDQEYVRKNL